MFTRRKLLHISAAKVNQAGNETDWKNIVGEEDNIFSDANAELVYVTIHYNYGAVVDYDLNGDGVFNTKDLVRLMKYIAADGDGIEMSESADINGDGIVNSKDVVRLMKFLAKTE